MTKRRTIARLLIPTALLSLIPLTATTPAAPAAAAPQFGLCNTRGHVYCVHKTWGTKFASAISYAVTASKKERKPVPFPLGTSYYIGKKYYVVYAVTYSRNGTSGSGTPELWKYGITSVSPWKDRANVGRRACEKASYTRVCRIDWVAVADKKHGFYYARQAEAALFLQWSRKHNHTCPPGALSCK